MNGTSLLLVLAACLISRCSLAKVAPDKTNNQNQTKSFIILVTLNKNNRMGVMRQT